MNTTNVAEFIFIAFPALFVILNPLISASSFISMTIGVPVETQHRIAKKACWTALIAILVFTFAGHLIFRIFNITVEAFRIAGGIVLFTTGFQMLKLSPFLTRQVERAKEEAAKRPDHDIGIVPLGIPIMCGPGTITTVLVLTAEIEWKSKLMGMLQMSGLLISAVVSVILIYFMLIHSNKLMEVLKKTGMEVLNRIMGLFLTVIATQFVINGVKELLPKFAPLLK